MDFINQIFEFITNLLHMFGIGGSGNASGSNASAVLGSSDLLSSGAPAQPAAEGATAAATTGK